MITKIESIISKHADVIRDLNILLSISHSQDDYSGLVKGLGGEIEKFLKDAVYNNRKNRENFYDLIENLSHLGISNSSITGLHNIRSLYNDFKHSPSFTTDILNVLKIVGESLEALNEIETKNIGNITGIYAQHKQRIIWISAWDIYLGGMTEINLFLPDNDLEFPICIEEFNIEFTGWEKIKEKYCPLGLLKMGKEYVSDKAYNIWESGQDFSGAGSFNGDIKELIKDLSSFINKRKEEELLDDFKRKNDSPSVKAAIVFSLCDCFADDRWNDYDDLKDEIRIRAAYDYGIEIESKLIESYLKNLNQEIENQPREVFKNIEDIRWLDESSYKKEKIIIDLIKNFSVALNNKKEIICRMK